MARSRFRHLDGDRGPQVVAHRGASRAARENTVEAFAKARALRADGVEIDVRRSADGVLVVHHDAAHPAVGVLVEVAFDEIRARAPWIPTLDEALDACEGMWVNVEIKNLPFDPDWDESEGIGVEVGDALRARSLGDRVLVSSFTPATLTRVRGVDESLATALLVMAWVDPLDAVESAAAAGHVAVNPEYDALAGDRGRRVVERAEALGIAVLPWTVDEPADVARLVGDGVAGVITNVPDVARRALGEPATRRAPRA